MARRPAQLLLAYELTQEHKDEFVRLVYEGYRPDQAAHELGSTGTQFRCLRNPAGANYDPAFADAFREAITSEQHRSGWLEIIRDAVGRAALGGNARLLEKLSFIYDPDWEPLRNQNLNVNVQMIARVLPYISNAELEKAIEAAEAEHKPELKALPKPEAA